LLNNGDKLKFGAGTSNLLISFFTVAVAANRPILFILSTSNQKPVIIIKIFQKIFSFWLIFL
jgi:hypothetical protein